MQWAFYSSTIKQEKKKPGNEVVSSAALHADNGILNQEVVAGNKTNEQAKPVLLECLRKIKVLVGLTF